MRIDSRTKPFAAHAAAVLLAASLGIACKSDSQSAVSDGGDQNKQAATAVNSGAASVDPGNLAASATPATVPTTPVGPVGQTTPTLQGSGNPEEKRVLGNIPVTLSPAKPALTPEPDPFPPRPTPTVVMAEGRIVQQWQAPAEASKLANPFKDKPDAAKIGREYYMQRCADCHGKNGQGNGWMSATTKRDGKPLTPTNLASRMVQANSDGELFWKITNGKSPMPANRVRFDDEQRWYIVSYLRSLKQ
jgi:mono/diheme cytochrome c family protein